MRKSVWVAVEYDGEFLILKRGKKANNPGLWNMPGGGTEKGETPRATAARELYEEAGIKIPENRLVLLGSLKKGSRAMAYFHVKLTKKPRVKIDFESAGFKWRSLADFPKTGKLHFQTRFFLKNVDKLLGEE